MQSVHVGDGNVKLFGVGVGVGARLDGDRQCTELLTLIRVGCGAVEPRRARVAVDNGGIFAERLQYRIRREVGVDNPFIHQRGILGDSLHLGSGQSARSHVRTHPPAAKLTVAVEEAAVELHLRKVTHIGREGAVVSRRFTRTIRTARGEGGTVSVVIVTADARGSGIGNQFASINAVLVGTAEDIAIEHAVDYGGAEIGVFTIRFGSSASIVVIAHDARSGSGGTDIGIAVTIDDARVILQIANNSTSTSPCSRDNRMRFRTIREVGAVGQDTTVVNAAITFGGASNSSYSSFRTANIDILKRDILHRTAVDGVEDGMGETANDMVAAIEDASELLSDCVRVGNAEVGHHKVVVARVSAIDIAHEAVVVRCHLYQIGVGCRSRALQALADGALGLQRVIVALRCGNGTDGGGQDRKRDLTGIQCSLRGVVLQVD